MKASENEVGRGEGETRRAALKRFGRYAAAAPVAMVLLDPRTGHAMGSKNKKRRNGKNRNNDNNGDTYGLPPRL